MEDAQRYLASLIELIGLLLIAVELYLPSWAAHLKRLLEGKSSEREASPQPEERRRQTWYTLGIFLAIWVGAATIAALWDPALALAVNVVLTLVTIFFGLTSSAIRLLIRLGVKLGRGNSIGGVGLVLALIGFSLEVSGLLAN